MRFGKILIGDNSVSGWKKTGPFWSGKLVKKEPYMSQELLTVAQFKERYQISHTAFYRQVKAGTLRTIKIGASTRVRLADAQAWLANLSGGAA